MRGSGAVCATSTIVADDGANVCAHPLIRRGYHATTTVGGAPRRLSAEMRVHGPSCEASSCTCVCRRSFWRMRLTRVTSTRQYTPHCRLCQDCALPHLKCNFGRFVASRKNVTSHVPTRLEDVRHDEHQESKGAASRGDPALPSCPRQGPGTNLERVRGEHGLQLCSGH